MIIGITKKLLLGNKVIKSNTDVLFSYHERLKFEALNISQKCLYINSEKANNEKFI